MSLSRQSKKKKYRIKEKNKKQGFPAGQSLTPTRFKKKKKIITRDSVECIY